MKHPHQAISESRDQTPQRNRLTKRVRGMLTQLKQRLPFGMLIFGEPPRVGEDASMDEEAELFAEPVGEDASMDEEAELFAEPVGEDASMDEEAELFGEPPRVFGQDS